MGWSLRKSINFGPFRVNLSKSGVGVSAGVTGARISTGPRGTYINLGGNGIYYRQKINTGQSRVHSHSHIFERPSGSSNSDPRTENFETNELLESSREATVEQLNSYAKKSSFTLLTVIFVVLIAMILAVWLTAFVNAFGYLLFVLVFLFCGIAFIWQVHKYDEHRRTMPFVYELDDSANKNFARKSQACEALINSSQVWCMSYAANCWNFAQAVKKIPAHISTNIDVWSIVSPGIMLSFFPDQMLIWSNSKYESIAYQDLYFQYQLSPPSIIHGAPPPDAVIVDQIWLHSRKDGGPDLRYKYNPLLPIVRYGQVALTHRSGNTIYLQTSNPQAALNFCKLMINEEPQAKANSERQKQQRPETKKPSTDKSAYEILQVEVSASKEEITAAYRSLVKLNHPDKVASLAPEFRELAEQRMKVINAAYQTLIKQAK